MKASDLKSLRCPLWLAALPIWLTWQYEPNKNPLNPKPDKVPYYASGHRRVGKQGTQYDRAKLVTFEEARAAALRHNRTGVGFALLPEGEVTALDIDGTDKEPAELLPFMATTYSERSPSGKGFRAIFKGNLGNHKAISDAMREKLGYGFEVFSTTGFVTFTGDIIDACDLLGRHDTIAEVPPKLTEFCEKLFPQRSQANRQTFKEGSDAAWFADAMSRVGVTPEQAAEHLRWIEPDCSYDMWCKQVGMALHYEFRGEYEGFELWDDWSQGAMHRYPGDDIMEAKWRSFHHEEDGRGKYRYPTIIHLSNKARRKAEQGEPGKPPPKEPPGSAGGFPAPFEGFMAAVVAEGLATAHRPQPALTLLATLITMASFCPARLCLPDGARLNLYGVGVSPTTSGKDHPQTMLKRMVTSVKFGPTLMGRAASGPGIEDSLIEGESTVSTVDEIGHLFAARNVRGGDPHLITAEIALLQLFTAGASSYVTRALKDKKSRTIHNPTFSMLGFSTPAKLGEALSTSDVLSGLLGRMLVARGEDDVPLAAGVRRQFSLGGRVAATLDNVVFMGQFSAPVVYSADAETRRDELALLFDAEMRDLPQESAARILRGRSVEKLLRVAGVVAVFDAAWHGSMTVVIEREHLDWAEALVRASDAELLQFTEEHMFDGKVQADAAKVRKAAASMLNGGAPKSASPSEQAALKELQVPRNLAMQRARIDQFEMEKAVGYLVALGEMGESVFDFRHSSGRETAVKVVWFVKEE